MVEYSNGFTMMELYKIPTYLRMFYYEKLIESKKKHAEDTKQAQSSNTSSKVRIKR